MATKTLTAETAVAIDADAILNPVRVAIAGVLSALHDAAESKVRDGETGNAARLEEYSQSVTSLLTQITVNVRQAVAVAERESDDRNRY